MPVPPEDAARILYGSLRTQARNLKLLFGTDGMPPEVARLVRTWERLDAALQMPGSRLPEQWRRPGGRCGIAEHAADLRPWAGRAIQDLNAALGTIQRLDTDLGALVRHGAEDITTRPTTSGGDVPGDAVPAPPAAAAGPGAADPG